MNISRDEESFVYRSPVGPLLVSSDGDHLTGLRRLGSGEGGASCSSPRSSILSRTAAWLESYFRGERPSPSSLPIHLGGTSFQRSVWQAVRSIPYGTVTTYGALAEKVALVSGGRRTSPRSVGAAIARNPVLVIVPCHRVIGADGTLTGYAGGIGMKEELLRLEGADLAGLPAGWRGDALGEPVDRRPRCSWATPRDPAMIRYHDEVWGVPVHDDRLLFKYLVLETFQSGLSWECVFSKEAAFDRAFGGFDLDVVCAYGEGEIAALLADTSIIRHEGKIRATVGNGRVFRAIQREFGSFDRYLWGWTSSRVIRESGATRSPLSDALSADLRRRGMKQVGSTTIYAYLQAVGVIRAHEPGCFLAD